MTIKEKIQKYIDYKGISVYRLEAEAGLSKGYWGKTKSISADIAMKISRVYGDMSTEWLLRDKGEMIKNAEREQKTIEISESAISKTKRKGALIYDIDATCGLSGRDIEFTDEKVIGSIDAPEINPDSKIIFATGDSMLPLIASGDRVVIRKIESWDYFNYGQVYLIITNEYRLIKRVRRHPKDADNLILLRSENPNYDDIDLPKREIIHLFIVENILSIMKKLLLIAFLAMCSMYSFAQLTEGKYKILSVKGFMNEKTVYENTFADSTAIVRVTPQLVNIVISGYSANTYAIEKPQLLEGNYLYTAKEIQSNSDANLLFRRVDEYPQLDGGLLIINRSENYADIFIISKEN